MGSTKTEQDRLHDHLESFGQKRLLALVRPGMRILDVGCGPGAVTAVLAQATGPAGRVVGVDLQEAHLERARAHARDLGLDNVRFEVADASALAYDAGAFDLVYAKFLVMHVPDRVGVIGEMARVLTDRGVLFLYDVEDGGSVFWPPGTAAERAWRVSMTALREGGSDPELGRKLYGLLTRAGLTGVRVIPEMTGACAGQERFYRAAKRQIAGMLGSLRSALIGRGHLDEASFDALLAELEVDEPDEFFTMCGMAAWGTKAAAG